MEGARIGNNPHKPGRPSYHPLLVVDVKARSVVDGYLRPGDAASGNGLIGFIKKIMAESRGKSTDITFRLDKCIWRLKHNRSNQPYSRHQTVQ